MFQMLASCFLLLFLSILSLAALSKGLEADPYDFSSSYFCSTCFTNNQDQNYHCCFYFFKCCAEARRGSKSTTPGPNYPALPTRIAYIVQDQTTYPCIKNCRSNLSPPALCCHSWETKNTDASDTTSTENYFKAAEEFDGYVEADSMVKNSTEEDEDSGDSFEKGWTTSQKSSDTDKPFHLALGANVNPSNLDSRYFDINRKLFIPPSLASGHESFDLASTKEGLASRKLGWITKDLLKSDEEKK